MEIIVDDLSGPEIAAFLAEHVRDMLAITPLESKHALDLDGLRRPEVTFWSVLDGDALVGCGAIKRLEDRHAEVKSMRTAADRRGIGVASVLLAHILAEAKAMGFARLSLFSRPARERAFPARPAALCEIRLRILRPVRRLPAGSAQRLHDEAALVSPVN